MAVWLYGRVLLMALAVTSNVISAQATDLFVSSSVM